MGLAGSQVPEVMGGKESQGSEVKGTLSERKDTAETEKGVRGRAKMQEVYM